MEPAILREAAVYGAAPGAATVAALVVVGRSGLLPFGAGALLILALHVAAVGTIILGRTAKGRNLDYAEHAYSSGTTDTTDMQAVVSAGVGGVSDWKRVGFAYSIALLVFSLAGLAFVFG